MFTPTLLRPHPDVFEHIHRRLQRLAADGELYEIHSWRNHRADRNAAASETAATTATAASTASGDEWYAATAASTAAATATATASALEALRRVGRRNGGGRL